MIVSASYRTDIPAFWGDWFRARLAAGVAEVRNPYGGPPATVRLTVDAADGFVFWTRNAVRFLPVLKELAAAGRPFVVSYTAIGYPRAIDRSVPAIEESVGAMAEIARRHGRRSVVWRYDPVLWTSHTDGAWHERQFARLARRLGSTVDEVVLSSASIYAKSARNLAARAVEHGFEWRDPPDDEKRALLSRLAGIAADEGLRPTLCSQPHLLAPGLAPARCIDVERLGDVAGRPIAARTRGNRPGCLCAESRDIGAYDSCAQGCAYCYAVGNQRRAAATIAAADMNAPRLGATTSGQSDDGGASLATPTSAGRRSLPFSV